MATDIVGSLFGVTPEMYQQRQAALADQQALQFAQLTPMQQAQAGIYRGAYGLAGALGGALGAQDPQLQLISARNSIARQIDYNNPESIMQGVNALSQAGDTVGAMQLADVARKMESEMAQRFQRTAAGQASLAQANRERATSTPADIAKAARIGELVNALQTPDLDEMTRANLQAQLDALRPATKEGKEPTTNELTNARAIAAQAGPVGSPEYNAAFTAEYNRLTAPKEAREPTTNELTNARALAAQAGPVGSPEYNAAFMAEYNRLTAPKEPPTSDAIRQYEFARSPAGGNFKGTFEQWKNLQAPKVEVKNLLPGQAVPRKDWMDFTQNVLSKDPVMLRTSTIISDAPAAIDIIRTSMENDISAAALPGALARLTGEGKNMSNEDVRRFARTGGLDDRIAQDVVKFFTGRTTTVKKDQAEKFATALYRGALIERRKKLMDEADQFGYLESPNYKTALRQIDDQLGRLPTPGAKDNRAPTPAAAGTPIYARNPTTGARIMSTDGGVNWTSVR
jgi:hypothetical protein